MPAENLTQLFAFESAIEAATRSILQAAGLPDTYVSQGTDNLPPAYIEVTFSPGPAINQAVRLVGTESVETLDYDFYDGQLTLRIVTPRTDDQPVLPAGVATMHESWAAGVRVALREAAAPFTEARLPYHAVKTIRPLGTERGLEPPPILQDFTRLDFALQFGIRSTAWPAGQ